jgi:hypothetical protein
MEHAALSREVLAELERLRATIEAGRDIPIEVHTHVGRRTLAPAVAAFAYGVTWPSGETYCARHEEFPNGVEFATVEFLDEGDFYGGVAVLQIAYSETGFEYLLPVEGGDTPGDPPVYCVDHAGPYELEDRKALSIFLHSLMSESQSVTEPGVTFADAKLALAVYKALGADAPLSSQQLASVARLELHLHGVERLDGLDHCRSLRTLRLDGYRLRDLSVLLRLPKLRELALPYDAATLEPIASLTRLVRLDARQATDLSPIAGMIELRELSGMGEVTSLAPLAKLSQLESVWLPGALVPDDDPVACELRQRGVKLVLAGPRRWGERSKTSGTDPKGG